VPIAQQLLGVLDAARLQRRWPDLAPAQWDPQHSPLLRAYRSYVSDVSSAGHAASLEASVYLDTICRARRPLRMLDTGSGFSSYVLRCYARSNPSAEVVSADHSREWLDKTRAFLAEHGLCVDGLVDWATLEQEQPQEGFDVIFHDLAGGAIREKGMPIVARMLRPGGCLIFDDAHHGGHRRQIYRTARAFSLNVFSLRRWVLDDYGRFAFLAI
jgi:predicted O-methyltransferase YrrM